jgi:hypothetical protein
MLAHLRREAGYTQDAFVSAFAQWARRMEVDATVSVRQLRRWEGEEPPLPHHGQQAVLEAMFGLPLAEMGFTVPANRRNTSELRQDNPVQRRKFIADLGSMTATVALPTGNRIGMADVNRFRAGIDQLYRLDHASGGRTAMAHAHQLLDAIGHKLANGTAMPRVAVQLQAMLGEIHCHLGWIAHDAGRDTEARTSVLEALAAARMTGDAQLEMRALSTMSLLAVDQQRAWEAASATSTAQAIAANRAGPGVRLVLSLRESRAALATGDLGASRRALSAALSLHDRATDETDAPRWVRFAGPVEIDYATGTHYIKTGQPAAAIPFFRAAVDGLAASYARNTALYRARLASVLLAAGEVDEACQTVNQVVRDARGLSSARLVGRLNGFSQRASRIDTAAARDAVDLIESERPPT